MMEVVTKDGNFLVKTDFEARGALDIVWGLAQGQTPLTEQAYTQLVTGSIQWNTLVNQHYSPQIAGL